jgi:alpha-beta hydrolase superfamily lysophospholipase
MKRIGIAILLIALLTGCTVQVRPRQSAPAQTGKVPPVEAPKQRVGFVVLHVPGISGYQRLDAEFLRALSQELGDAKTQFFDWPGKDKAGLNALLHPTLSRDKAKELATIITQLSTDHPHSNIVITSHSGGCGVTAWALEQLPAGVRVQQWIQIQSALSPGYDLTPALRHVDLAQNFYSPYDDIVLGTGTRTMGTIDRVRTDAAGKVGFSREYPNLTQVPYDRAWIEHGNYGDHIGSMMPRFAKNVLAPRIAMNQLNTSNGK